MYSVRFGTGAALLTGMTHSKRAAACGTPQKLNFGPQVGFAWTPGLLPSESGTSRRVRPELQRRRDRDFRERFRQPRGLRCQPNFSRATPTSINPGIVYADAERCSFDLSDILPIRIRSARLRPNGLPTTGTVERDRVRTNMPTMYTEHYSLDTQTELGRSSSSRSATRAGFAAHLLSL